MTDRVVSSAVPVEASDQGVADCKAQAVGRYVGHTNAVAVPNTPGTKEPEFGSDVALAPDDYKVRKAAKRREQRQRTWRTKKHGGGR